MGFESAIYADPAHVAPAVRDACESLHALQSLGGSDVVLHHYSISSPAVDVFLALTARKIMIYHNITPAKCFMGFADDVAWVQANCGAGADGKDGHEIRCLIGGVAFDASDLKDAGVRNVKVFALPFDPAVVDVPPEPYILNSFSGGGLKNILFVGRIAPNKRIERI